MQLIFLSIAQGVAFVKNHTIVTQKKGHFQVENKYEDSSGVFKHMVVVQQLH